MPSAYRAEVIGSLLRPAAAFVPLERLALRPQCGFASTEEGNLLTPADQEAKLTLVSETARGLGRLVRRDRVYSWPGGQGQ